MKLYYHPLSDNSRLALAIGSHLGITFDLHQVDFAAGELSTPEFRRLNPSGRVPVLVDGDFVLWESNAIAQYLCEKERSALLPADVRTRADIARWQSWSLNHLSVGVRTVTFERLVKPMMGGTPDETKVAAGLAQFAEDAKVLETHLEGRRFLVGDQVTLADFSAAAQLTYAVPAELPLDGKPNLSGWLARMNEQPAWARTAPKLG